MHLLIDLGGTNTRLALSDETGVLAQTMRKMPNHGFAGLEDVVAAYLDALKPPDIKGLCAGVAGPVQGNTAQLTNHDWFVDGEKLGRICGTQQVYLLNDLQAQGYALDDLSPDAVTPVIPGQPVSKDATRLVLNLGTGCNIAVVHRIGNRLFVPPAESGHSTLPDLPDAPPDLFAYLRGVQSHLPIEAAISGPGLSNIHRFFTGQMLAPETILTLARGADDAARTTCDVFIHILAHLLGNFALHHLPMGGIFLSGSLSPALAPYIARPDFVKTLTARGPYTEIVKAIGISVIHEDGFALQGCHRFLAQMAGQNP